MPSHTKERKSMTGRSSLKDSGITLVSGVPPDLDLRDQALLGTPELPVKLIQFGVNYCVANLYL